MTAPASADTPPDAPTPTPAPPAAPGSSGLFDWMFRWRGWLVIASLAAVLGFSWPIRPDPWMVLWATPITVLGALTRVWARSHFLRGSDTRKVKSARLILGGPYRHVRNPLYVGNILGQGGLVMAFTEWRAALIFMAVLLVLYEGIVRSEEAVLLRSHGEPYAVFKSQVPRWVPRLRSRTGQDVEATRADFATAFRKERQRLTGFVAALAIATGLAFWIG